MIPSKISKNYFAGSNLLRSLFKSYLVTSNATSANKVVETLTLLNDQKSFLAKKWGAEKKLPRKSISSDQLKINETSCCQAYPILWFCIICCPLSFHGRFPQRRQNIFSLHWENHSWKKRGQQIIKKNMKWERPGYISQAVCLLF